MTAREKIVDQLAVWEAAIIREPAYADTYRQKFNIVRAALEIIDYYVKPAYCEHAESSLWKAISGEK